MKSTIIGMAVALGVALPSSLSDLGRGKSANFTMRDEKAGFPDFPAFSRAFPSSLPTVDAMRPGASNSTPSKPASTRQ